jgi:hypothetical protein
VSYELAEAEATYLARAKAIYQDVSGGGISCCLSGGSGEAGGELRLCSLGAIYETVSYWISSEYPKSLLYIP